MPKDATTKATLRVTVAPHRKGEQTDDDEKRDENTMQKPKSCMQEKERAKHTQRHSETVFHTATKVSKINIYRASKCLHWFTTFSTYTFGILLLAVWLAGCFVLEYVRYFVLCVFFFFFICCGSSIFELSVRLFKKIFKHCEHERYVKCCAYQHHYHQGHYITRTNSARLLIICAFISLCFSTLKLKFSCGCFIDGCASLSSSTSSSTSTSWWFLFHLSLNSHMCCSFVCDVNESTTLVTFTAIAGCSARLSLIVRCCCCCSCFIHSYNTNPII